MKALIRATPLRAGWVQYPKVGVEFVNWFSQTHKFCFLVGQKT